MNQSINKSINDRGLSKSKSQEIFIENFPGALSSHILDQIQKHLKKKHTQKKLAIHVGTNNLTNNVNLLINVKGTLMQI